MSAPSPTPLTERLRLAGWLVLCLALIPAGVAQWRSHERLLHASKHEPVPPDWVRYDAAREHFAGAQRVHIFSDVDTRLLLLRRFDLQFSALPAVVWETPPGRNPCAPPDEHTAFLIDTSVAWKTKDFSAKIHAAALAAGFATTEFPVTDTLLVLRFERMEPDG
ncbi:MAG: hypothetical protein DHS20C15_27250 [Planctomycetota bacterium]|nr:MAG: hypothetical protein DHS20C15_27250 [Planctomycetota bacterium]